MSTVQSLIAVPPLDWAELRDLYLRDWPRYEVAYVTLQNYIDWAERRSLPDGVTIYSLPETWGKDGTVIIVNGEYLFIHTLDETLETLRRAMVSFKWDQSYLVAMTSYRSLVLDVYQTLGLELVLDIPNVFYHLPAEKALKLTVQLPEGFTTGRIDPRHASLINDRWRHKGPGSGAVIEGLLQRNLSMGLYDASGQLVGWCIREENGSLAMLGVETKRRGYGSIVVKAFAKHLAARGLNAYACVITTNEPSRALFVKLGFTERGGVDYLKNSTRTD